MILVRLLFLLARFIHYSATKDEREQPTQHFDTPLAEVQPIAPAVIDQNYEKMVEKSSQLITKYPEDAAAYSDRGGAYILLKRYDDALVDLDKAIELKSYYADALNNRSLLFCANHEFQLALNDLNYAIERIPADTAYYLNRGMCYRMMGNQSQAGPDFDHALQDNWKLVQLADKVNRSTRTIPNIQSFSKDEARRLFFKMSVVLVKYSGNDYLHVL